jgi:hypothetical protein
VDPEAAEVSLAERRQSLDPTLLERHQRFVQDSRPILVAGLDWRLSNLERRRGTVEWWPGIARCVCIPVQV